MCTDIVEICFGVANGQISSIFDLDPIYTGLVTMVQVVYLLEICCRG